MKIWTRISAAVALLLVAGVCFTPAHTSAAEDIAAMITAAKTAADHEAIASYFDKEAAAAKENGALHTKMLAAIKGAGGPGVAKWHMDKHCEQLIKEYEAAAKMYTEMAAAHREMAKAVK